MIDAEAQTFYVGLRMNRVPFNTTLKSEILLHLHFEAKYIESYFPGCNESLFSMNQLFVELSSMSNFVLITIRIQSSAYKISLQFTAISMSLQ